MNRMTRMTVSVPTSLLEEVDRRLVKGDEGRSAVIRRLLEVALRAIEEREDVERFVRGYRERPQTEEEFGWSDAAARDGIAELPWP
ncbi:MAG: hypothetical protein ACRDIY_16820 [Chloroflexota bacterium]